MILAAMMSGGRADLGFRVGAGEGNRTLMTSSEGFGCNASELPPPRSGDMLVTASVTVNPRDSPSCRVRNGHARSARLMPRFPPPARQESGRGKPGSIL
jgi:hypothetical protein